MSGQFRRQLTQKEAATNNEFMKDNGMQVQAQDDFVSDTAANRYKGEENIGIKQVNF